MVFHKLVLIVILLGLNGCIVVENQYGETYTIKPSNVTDTPRFNDPPRSALPNYVVQLANSGVRLTKFSQFADGAQTFRYIDPQSPIVDASPYTDTGFVTYMIKDGDDGFRVKNVDVLNNSTPKLLGYFVGKRGEWRYTPTGSNQTYAGHGYYFSSKGLVLTRGNNNVFTYFTPNSQPKAYLLPEHYVFAWHQKADIEVSRILTIRKPLRGTFIAPTQFEIAFFNIDRGTIVDQLNMQLDTNSPGGNFKNSFWMFNTPTGPISITKENLFKQVVVRNLKTGQTRIAFERDMGIAFVSCLRKNNGRIELEASVGFSDMKIYDVEQFLATGKAD